MGNGCCCKPSQKKKAKEVLLVLHPNIFSQQGRIGKMSFIHNLQKQKNIFRISLTNMYVKNIQEELPQNRTYYISVKFLNLDKSFQTELLHGRDVKIDQVFEEDIELTEQEILECEVLIQLLHYRQNYQVVAVKQNLLATAKGPYHHDLIINWPNVSQLPLIKQQINLISIKSKKSKHKVDYATILEFSKLLKSNYKSTKLLAIQPKGSTNRTISFVQNSSHLFHNQFWDLSKESIIAGDKNACSNSPDIIKNNTLALQKNMNDIQEDFEFEEINEFTYIKQMIPFMNTNRNEIKQHDHKDNLENFRPSIKQRTIHKVSSFILDNGKTEKPSPAKKKRRSSENFQNNNFSFEPQLNRALSSHAKIKQKRISHVDIDKPKILIQEEQGDDQQTYTDDSLEYQQLQIQNANTIFWELDNDKIEIVQLQFQITTQAVGNGCIKFCLWVSTQHQQIKEDTFKNSSDDDDYSDSENNQKKQIKNQVTFYEEQIAECYIPFSKLLAQEANIIVQDDITYEQRHLHIQEKLWNQGQEFGFVDLEIQSLTLPYIKQILVGLMTEKGIQKSSPSVYFRDENIDSEINQLAQAKNLLIENTFRLQQNEREIVGFERLKLKEEILNHFNQVFQITQMTHKQSTTSFYYKSQSDLIRAQYILIELADHLLNYADEVDEYLRESYYKCLKMILNRGEFNLDNIGFKQSYQQFVKGKAQNIQFKTNQKHEIQDLKNKLSVGLQYQNLMYLTLQKVLEKTESKYLNGEEKGFVENYCAIAFFRLPLFQKQFLECLKFNEEAIPEDLKAIFQYFDHKISISEGNKIFESLFDWQQFFELYMLSDKKGEANYEKLKEIIKTPIILIIQKTVISKDHIPWNELPGYGILLKSFLIQMAKKETKNLVDSLKIASMNLLLNPYLLKIYIHIAYRKTKILDHKNVLSTFNLIDLWMQTLTSNQQNIPADFDLKSFFKGIQIILEGDHAMCISKGLVIIYNNYPLLSNDIKQEVNEYLFGNIFFKLFMHWSYNVRYIFHHLLVYRIEHLTKKIQFHNITRQSEHKINSQNKQQSYDRYNYSLVKVEDLNKKYLRMMKVLENAKYNYQHLYNDQVATSSKISLAQRLKLKLAQRKKNLANENKTMRTGSHQQILNQDDELKQIGKAAYQINNTLSIENSDQDNQMLYSVNTPRQRPQNGQNSIITAFTEGLIKEDNQMNSRPISTVQSKHQNNSPPQLNGTKNDLTFENTQINLTTPRNNSTKKKIKHKENKSVQFNQNQKSSLTIIEQSFLISEMEINTIENNLASGVDKSFISKSSKHSRLEQLIQESSDENQSTPPNAKKTNKYKINKIKRSQTEEIRMHFQKEELDNEDDLGQYSPSVVKRNNRLQLNTQNGKHTRESVKRISFISPNKKQKALISGNKFLYIETLDKGNSLKKIEKQYIRYLPKAFEEFLQIKMEYAEWFSQHQHILDSMLNYDKLVKYLKEMEVPQVIMKQSIDGLEGYGQYSDE